MAECHTPGLVKVVVPQTLDVLIYLDVFIYRPIDDFQIFRDHILLDLAKNFYLAHDVHLVSFFGFSKPPCYFEVLFRTPG